jgi:hypothetical protein
MQTNTKFLLVFFLLSFLTVAPDLFAQNHDQYGGLIDMPVDEGTGYFELGKIKNTVQPLAGNSNLICYFFTDVPVWEIEKYGKSWIDFYKGLDQDSPGGSLWGKWKADNPDKAESEFIPVIARKLYSKAVSFVKKYDPNHLIFGDRYIEYHFPESALKESLPYMDGIAIQPKNFLSFEFFDEVYKKYKKPIFVCDHVTSYATDEYSNTMGQVADNVDDYLEYYRSSVYQVMSKPYMVGYNKCQFQDELNGTQLKQGLYRQNGEPYEYIDSLFYVHSKALDTAYTVPAIDLEGEAEKLMDWGKYEDLKKEAIERIEKYRKGNEKLKIVLPDGELAVNTVLQVKLKRHDFKWGAVMKESFVTSPHQDKYKEIYLKYINATGFGVACKPKFRNTTREANMLNKAMPWLLKNDFYVRGHTLAWEGYNFLRPEDKAIYDNTSLSDEVKGDSLLESMGKHFPHAIPQWDVRCWDVSNEPIANNLVNDLLPDINSHVHWFKLADSIKRESGKEDVVLYQNDYQIISAISSWAMGRPATYRKVLDDQIARGAPIGGIGFQSRLKHGLITPDSIYKRLCDFDRYNLPFQATEFEIRDDASKYEYTDAERRLLTEYMMVMYFSHPKVNGFWHWTFADGNSNENLDYPLFKYDGTPKVNGLIWMEMMDGFLSTDVKLATNDNAEMDVRGYYGKYDLISTTGNEILIGNFEIDSTNTDSIIEVQFDAGFQISGLENGAAYELDQELIIDIAAFSNYGDISSIVLLHDFEHIGVSSDSSLVLSYTPTSAVEGWNEFTMRSMDEHGNSFTHSLDVYFGDTLPAIEFISLPADTIFIGSTGNILSFSVRGTYGNIESIYVSYAGSEIFPPISSGNYEYMLDDLSPGNYEFIIEVTDDKGNQISETVSFSIVLAANILPSIEVTAPQDSALLYTGNNILIAIDALDSDGTISKVEVFLNDSLSKTFSEGPYDLYLGSLTEGEHTIVAVATDDREGSARDTVVFSVQDSTTSLRLLLNPSSFNIYPNPTSNTLHFSMVCDYEIYTILGRRILEGKQASKVDVSRLEEGMYLFKTNYGTLKFRK